MACYCGIVTGPRIIPFTSLRFKGGGTFLVPSFSIPVRVSHGRPLFWLRPDGLSDRPSARVDLPSRAALPTIQRLFLIYLRGCLSVCRLWQYTQCARTVATLRHKQDTLASQLHTQFSIHIDIYLYLFFVFGRGLFRLAESIRDSFFYFLLFLFVFLFCFTVSSQRCDYTLACLFLESSPVTCMKYVSSGWSYI